MTSLRRSTRARGTKLLSLAALCLVALAGCFSSDSVRPRPWRPDDLASHYLRLVNPAGQAREYRFTGPGTARATVGQGAKAASTELRWTIEPDGSLRLFDAQNRTFTKLVILQVSAMHYTVDEAGATRVYVMEKWWE